MADASILDAFVVTLGLDPRGYQAGARQAQSDFRRVREEAHKSAGQIEADGKRAANYFGSLKSEVVGLYLAFAGATSLKDFARDILMGDAATGRLATNLGIATEQLSAWEGAITRVGGQAADADNALRGMVAAYQSYQLTGTTGHDADFQGLGVTLRDLRDPSQTLLKMAEAGERLGRPEFVARLQRIGIPEPTIVLLEKGRKGVEALLEQQRKLGVVTDRDAAEAQKLQDRLATLNSAIRGSARVILTDMVGALNAWLGSDQEMQKNLPVLEGAVGGVTIGIAAMTAELWIIPVAIGAIVAAVAAMEQKFQRIGLKGVLENLKDDLYLLARLATGHFGDALKSWEQLRKERGGPAEASTPPGTAAGGGRGVAPPAIRQRTTYGGLRAMLRAGGLDDEHAAGVAAGLMAESRGDPNGVNPRSGAWGIAQWLGTRARSFRRVIGHDLRGSSLSDQIRFLLWELHGGDHGGRSVLEAKGAHNVLERFIRAFERPKKGYEVARDISTGASYLGGAQTAVRSAAGNSTHVGQIVVNIANGSKATGEGIGLALRRDIRRRGLVTQSNGGLQ